MTKNFQILAALPSELQQKLPSWTEKIESEVNFGEFNKERPMGTTRSKVYVKMSQNLVQNKKNRFQ